jgi:formate dehydrogenase subunit delta
MNAERLVHMANQISLFFESQPTQEEAVAGVLDHLKRFWDPRMRAAIIACIETGGDGLREVARAAVVRLAADKANARANAA